MGYREAITLRDMKPRSDAAKQWRSDRQASMHQRTATLGATEGKPQLSKRQLKRRRQLAAKNAARKAERDELYRRVRELTEVSVNTREYAAELEYELSILKQSRKVMR